MLASLIKFYYIFFSTFTIYIKIIPTSHQFKVLKYTLPFIQSILAYLLKLYYPEICYIIPLLIFGIIFNFLISKPQLTFIATTIAFGISYTLYALSSLLGLIILTPLFYDNNSPNYNLLAVISAFIQIIIINSLFKTKRFRKGMPFLFTTKLINLATFIYMLLIFFLIYVQTNNSATSIQAFGLSVFLFSLIILIYWWQAQLTKTYKQRLLFRELESLRTELQEKDKLIAHLTEQNQELGRLIHRDNKRIPAMENAVCEYLAYEFTDSELLHQKGQELIAEIYELSTNRADTLANITNKHHHYYATGIVSFDALVNYMAKRCEQNNGKLSVHLAADLQQYIPKLIATEDFSHMLSDLLENAYLATSHLPNAMIQLQFYVAEKSFIIEVADNGTPFTPQSLINFGLTQLTTRAHSGGSGIGLMDIWRIKEKYCATLHIEEYETATPYTKKLSFIFNRKNQYTIRTYRKEELQKLVNRTDLQIYEHITN